MNKYRIHFQVENRNKPGKWIDCMADVPSLVDAPQFNNIVKVTLIYGEESATIPIDVLNDFIYDKNGVVRPERLIRGRVKLFCAMKDSLNDVFDELNDMYKQKTA